MKLPPLAAHPAPAAANDDDTAARPPLASLGDAAFRHGPAVARTVNRAGRTLAVLLAVEDPPADHIRVALDAFGTVAGTGFVSGTVH